MRITIRETKTGADVPAEILTAKEIDTSSDIDEWNFDWLKLCRIKNTHFYKLTLEKNQELQGLLLFQILNGNMLEMKDLEIAPHNFGSKGKYEKVAGCLIAFACLKSLELGKDNYKGIVVFDSKTELIDFYQRKYGAKWLGGIKMFIDENMGGLLIEKYLK